MRSLLSIAFAGAVLASTAAQAGPLQINVLLDGSSISGGVQSFDEGFVISATYSGASFTVTLGASGDPARQSPNFSSSSTDVKTGGGAGTISVLITDLNLPAYSGTVATTLNLNALSGGTSLTAASVATYFDASNTAFGTATRLSSIDGVTAGANPTAQSLSPNAFTGPFSETTIYTFQFAAGGNPFDTVSGNAQLLDVPEPASMALVGAGLAAAGIVRRRARR